MTTSDSRLLRIVLTQDDPSNTLLIDEANGNLLYTVFTETIGVESICRLRNALDEEMASWKWTDTASDILIVGGSSPQPVTSWIKECMVPLKDTVYFTASDSREYKWKGNSPGLVSELYDDDDEINPVARFTRSRHIINHELDPPIDESKPACLMMDERGLEIRDQVVLSFLLLERKRRITEGL